MNRDQAKDKPTKTSIEQTTARFYLQKIRDEILKSEESQDQKINKTIIRKID